MSNLPAAVRRWGRAPQDLLTAADVDGGPGTDVIFCLQGKPGAEKLLPSSQVIPSRWSPKHCSSTGLHPRILESAALQSALARQKWVRWKCRRPVTHPLVD